MAATAATLFLGAAPPPKSARGARAEAAVGEDTAGAEEALNMAARAAAFPAEGMIWPDESKWV